MSRPLFLRWLLINALALSFLVGMAVPYGHFLTGPSLVAVPVILLIGAAGSAHAGRICWWIDTHHANRAWAKKTVENVSFVSWACQIVGIMSTVFGFWIILGESGDTGSLGQQIKEGGGVALVGTFVGVFCSLVLALEERLIRHEVGE